MTRYASALLLLTTACIIPDRDIQFEGGPSNPGAVRILEQPPIPAQWTTWCLDREFEDTEAFCPSVRETTRQSGLVRADDGGDFCVCPDGQRDARAIAQWTIYAEDPDRAGDLAADVLYGAFMVDPDPLSADPSAQVAYQNYLEPCAPGEEIVPRQVTRVPGPAGDEMYTTRVLPSVARNEAPQWAFTLDDAQNDTIDLCNDDNGTALAPGLHNLQFMVTDRPFFRAQREDGGVERLQCGVPDVSVGATYAVINYVFECIDGTLEENVGACECEEVE